MMDGHKRTTHGFLKPQLPGIARWQRSDGTATSTIHAEVGHPTKAYGGAHGAFIAERGRAWPGLDQSTIG